MKWKVIFIGIVTLTVIIFSNCNRQVDFPVLKGPYLGQKPPGNTSELFAPGIVSTRYYENSITVSPDGNEICFAIASPAAGRGNLFVILILKKENDRWSRPQVAPFSGQYVDGFPCFSPDGTQLFFASYRPVEANAPPKKDWDIWVIDKTENGWSQPHHLGPRINTTDRESAPSITLDGTLYFKRSVSGSSDIYRSRLMNDQYEEPEKLSNAINSEMYEDHPFIAPDESYLLFSSWRRPNGQGEADLYISFHRGDDSWTPARNLGNKINTNAHENCPFVSLDGRYLFFNSYKKGKQEPYWEQQLSYDEVMQKLNDIHNGFPNIYWVDAKIIEDLKPADLK